MSEPYAPLLALEKIRSILHDGSYVILPHCRQRMTKRNVTEEDILKVLNENGVISKPHEYDNQHQKWKYTVDGFDIEKDELTVVVNIITENWLVVTITIF